MKMKNVLMILIALAVVLTMAGVVSATDYTQNAQEGSMDVNYTVLDSYTVTIPSEVIISGVDISTPGLVNVTNLLINPGKSLHIKLTSRNFTDTSGIYNLVNSGSYISYYINKTAAPVNTDINDGVENNKDILVVKAGEVHCNLTSKTGTAKIGNYTTLFFKTTTDFINNATKSGSHKDSLTFTFTVEEDTPVTP